MAKQGGQILVDDLRKSFGPVKAVNGLSFQVQPGSIVGFLGPNGAGKTTTLRMLVGLIRPEGGVAKIGGRVYRALPAPSDEVGVVLDAQGFHGARSGRSHLRIYCTINGYPKRRADEVLELVGLSEHGRRRVQGYSLGMRQRLALAAAMLGDPATLILDEPANGLDPEGIVWMRQLLRDLAADGRTILVSSHVLAEVQQLVDRVVIINHGHLVREGTLVELAATHRSPVSIRTPHADRFADALTASGDRIQVDRLGPDRLRVTGLDIAEVGHRAFTERVEVLELAAEQNDLEHIFFSLTSDSNGDVTANPVRRSP
jgi:ABC-2 type transport system ATP-binding protein